jgi:hypothetical protein
LGPLAGLGRPAPPWGCDAGTCPLKRAPGDTYLDWPAISDPLGSLAPGLRPLWNIASWVVLSGFRAFSGLLGSLAAPLAGYAASPRNSDPGALRRGVKMVKVKPGSYSPLLDNQIFQLCIINFL